ncbi:putative ferric reductase transmembrane component [Candida viswanathii]|uniref:ferric-chelate reductase (NADPH) n=1 Tax=Candida viswanathii TaxID=5486 RepID=A0A367XNW0_9ASCO|nr:putative ferric reductase transmembrane component [Candida viswanathii]
MNFLNFAVIVSHIAWFSFAADPRFLINGDGLVYWACDHVIGQMVTFCDEDVEYFDCACLDENALATLAGCMAYQNRNSSHAIKTTVEACWEYGGVRISKDWFEPAYQYYLDHAVDLEDIPDFNYSVPVTVPIKLNGSEIILYHKSYILWLGNYDDAFFYGAGALGYWLLVMFIEFVCNWSKILFPGLVKKLTFGPISWWRKYVSMPATFRKRKAQELPILEYFDCLVPSRYETLVIVGFYAYITAVHAIKMGFVEGNPIFTTRFTFRVRNVADRTGIVATVMMPLVFLYGGRNNLMQWLTGMSYSQFMTYHRHIARVMFLLVAVHSIAYTILEFDDYAEEAAEPYFYWGLIATISSGLIMIQAMLYFRRRWYEMFLLIHIAMAALYICGTWIHVVEFGYVWFSYATVAPWCFDRAVRTGRLIVFGFPKARVTLLADETLKVIIPKPSYWKSIPGGHAFIYFVRPSCFWQSHPFTFVDTPDDKNIVLYCKVKGGMTHGLYQYLAKKPDQTAKITVGVEGPYGEPTPAKYADTAVFLAGGNGIPGIYSEVMGMARRLLPDSKTAMRLIWVIREYKSLGWFQEELEALKNTNIQTTIYVTRPEVRRNSDDDKKVEGKNRFEEDKESIMSSLAHIDFKEDRPSIEEIVVDEIKDSAGSIAFVACGHPAMVDEVRYYAAENVTNRDHKRVDFYEQLQVWA